MDYKNLFLAIVLMFCSISIYADCGDEDYFPWAEVPEEAKKYEGNELLLGDENDSDVPAEWIDI